MTHFEPIAHLSGDGRSHSLYDHLTVTAKRAEEMADAFGCGGWGRVAGLWHDLGKYSEDFQRMIRTAHGPEAVYRTTLASKSPPKLSPDENHCQEETCTRHKGSYLDTCVRH